jgi:putative membrane protein
LRWLYLTIVIVFVAALIVFVFQNTQSVDISFLTLSVTLPLAMLVCVVYVLGALSGGSRTPCCGDGRRFAPRVKRKFKGESKSNLERF